VLRSSATKASDELVWLDRYHEMGMVGTYWTSGGPVFSGGSSTGESSAVGQREIFTLKRGVTKFKHTIASALRCGVRYFGSSVAYITKILCARALVGRVVSGRWRGRTGTVAGWRGNGRAGSRERKIHEK